MRLFEKFSNKASLKAKIISIIAFVSILTLFCLLSILLYTQHKILREALLDEVNIIAADLSGSLVAALIFDDQAQIEATMDNLVTKRQILYVQIDRENGETLQFYGHSGEATSYARTEPEVLQETGPLFGETLEICLPLQHRDEALGSLYLQVDLKPIRKTLLGYALFGLLALAGSAFFGLILALRLQKIILSPIEQLASTMDSVSMDQDFSHRIANDRGDEMGLLIDNFNNMLSQIDQRDKELSAQRDCLDHLAYHDFLTGLPNRLLFRDRLVSALARSKRTKKKAGLIFFDLDRFKNINDTLGHDVGDTVLKLVTQRLQQRIREEDTLARLGGDEFVLIVEEVQDQFAVALVAEKILQSLEPVFSVAGYELSVSASIGATCFPDDAETVEGLMKCADVAMYRSKAAGRSTFRFYTAEMDEQFGEAFLLKSQMHRALRMGS
jgi:diguanylate cyclase (GGDEF)-like protein